MPTIWWLVTLKRIEKIIQESDFDKKTNKPALKLTLAPTGFSTTGAWEFCINFYSKCILEKVWSVVFKATKKILKLNVALKLCMT